jgi:hypothetical protein
MSEYKFIPFGEPTNTTDEGRAMLAYINAVECDARLADVNSRAVYGRGLDELDLIRLKAMWRGIQIERRERERQANPTPGHCWQCGTATGGSSVECRPCHEGMTPAQYGRAMAGIFMTKPNGLPGWMR